MIPPRIILFGGFECDFVKDYKHLHDAGYDVIADDLLNYGRSADSTTRPEDVEIYDNLGPRQGALPDPGHDSAIRRIQLLRGTPCEDAWLVQFPGQARDARQRRAGDVHSSAH